MTVIAPPPRRRSPQSTAGAARGLEKRRADHDRRNRSSRVGQFQPVLTIRARVNKDQVPEFIQAALREIRIYISRDQIEVQGPPFSICRPLSPDRVDVEAGWPVRQARGNDRIESGSLPINWVRRGNFVERRRPRGQIA